jgi:hypothetical protein
MRPSLAGQYGVDVASRNVRESFYDSGRFNARRFHLPHGQNIGFAQFRGIMGTASVVGPSASDSPFGGAVGHIVFVSAKKQVNGIHAAGSIASMTYGHLCGDVADKNRIGDTMNKSLPSTPPTNPDIAVAFVVQMPRPQDASVGLFCASPKQREKTIDQIVGNMNGRHVRPPLKVVRVQAGPTLARRLGRFRIVAEAWR